VALKNFILGRNAKSLRNDRDGQDISHKKSIPSSIILVNIFDDILIKFNKYQCLFVFIEYLMIIIFA